MIPIHLLFVSAASMLPAHPSVIVVDEALASPLELAGPLLIYLDGSGVTLSNGLSDSTNNTSPLVAGKTTLEPSGLDPQTWGALMSCVREAFGPFGAIVTDRDPGAANHVELVVAASSTPLGFDFPISGVAPFACDGVDRAIAFTFVDATGRGVRNLCWTAVQEIGHTLGLEHEMQCGDPMTYLTGCDNVLFQNVEARCGETQPRACECGPAKQNSFGYLSALLGPGDTTPPTLSIRTPAPHELVEPGFTIRAEPLDAYAITRMSIELDGTSVGEARTDPWDLVVPARAGAGAHHIRTTVRDPAGNTATDDRDIEVRAMCTTADECGTAHRCTRGVCLSELGAACRDDGWCAEGLCRGTENHEQACRPSCRLGDDTTCADGAHCEYVEGAAVCMPPAPMITAGGCQAAGGAPVTLIVGALLVPMLRRRRRQRGKHV